MGFRYAVDSFRIKIENLNVPSQFAFHNKTSSVTLRKLATRYFDMGVIINIY